MYSRQEHNIVSDAESCASYEHTLQEELSLKHDVVLDFTCLKACLDPQREKTEGEQFNYEEFLSRRLNKGDVFPNLEILKVRNLVIPKPLTPQTEDYYADLVHGIMQFSNLVELDLSGVKLPEELQKHLTFWNMKRLKKLILDNMGLTSLPPSVGRLRQLEVLSLTQNQLSTLPVTLASCESLRELNLTGNRFTSVPSILLRLPHLEDLRRLSNPLLQLFDGFASPPHIKVSIPKTAKQQTSTVFNPDSLQGLCARAVFSNQMDYWASDCCVGPLQCRHLDCLASQFKLCEHCNAVVQNTGECTVDVMLLRYLDLRLVPVKFPTCSLECQFAVLQHYRQLQSQTQADMDREYEESMRQAEREANGTTPASKTSARTLHTSARHGRRKTMKKCSIM